MIFPTLPSPAVVGLTHMASVQSVLTGIAVIVAVMTSVVPLKLRPISQPP
jgi:hypothetical protein